MRLALSDTLTVLRTALAGRYTDSGTAETLVAAFTDAVNACQSFTETDPDSGATIEYRFDPLSFPDLGDGTFAARLTGTDVTFGR